MKTSNPSTPQSFGCTTDLYRRGVHPRVLVDPDDLVHLRRAIRTGTGRKIFTILRDRVAPLRDRILAANDLPRMLSQWNAQWDNPGTTVIWGLHDLAMVGVLTDDANAIEAVRRVLLALSAADQLVGRKGKNVGYGMAPYVPLAYDLIHDRLSATDRHTFVDWALNFHVRFALAHLGDAYFRTAGGNQPMGAMLTGFTGLLAIDGDPGVPDLVAEKRRFSLMLEAAINTAIGPAGYPEEDGGYGFGMAGWIAYAVEAVRRAGLLDAYRECPRFAKFGRAMLHFVQPWGEDLSNTGDHGDDFGERTFVLSRLAAETKDSTLIWLLETLCYPTHRILHTPGFHVEVPLAKGFQAPASAFTLLALDLLPKGVSPAKAKKPISTAFRDGARGIVTFRSGWDPDASLVVFDGSQRSPSAQGHFHYSSGHFSLTALGEFFAIDTGRYNIEQNCHNVVLIDGKSGRSTDGQWQYALHHGLLLDYVPGNFCDFAAVDSSHQHNCYWARRYLGLVKGLPVRGRTQTGADAPSYIWTVDDINKANDWAEFWWQLHTSPENVIEIHNGSSLAAKNCSPRREEGVIAHDQPSHHLLTSVATCLPHASIRGWRHGNFLDVHFALPAPESFPKPHVLALDQDIAGPSAVKYVGDVRAEEAKFARPSDMLHHCVWQRPRLLAKVGGYNGRFMSILLPRRKGDAPAKVERLPSIDNSLAVRLTFGRVVDTLIWAYEHHLLEADGITGRGNWCVVRRRQSSGQILHYAMGNGTSLSVGGKRLSLSKRR